MKKNFKRVSLVDRALTSPNTVELLTVGRGQKVEINAEKLSFLLNFYFDSLTDYATPQYRSENIQRKLARCQSHEEIDQTLEDEVVASQIQSIFRDELVNASE
jgi:hypothetical protein